MLSELHLHLMCLAFINASQAAPKKRTGTLTVLSNRCCAGGGCSLFFCGEQGVGLSLSQELSSVDYGIHALFTKKGSLQSETAGTSSSELPALS